MGAELFPRLDLAGIRGQIDNEFDRRQLAGDLGVDEVLGEYIEGTNNNGQQVRVTRLHPRLKEQFDDFPDKPSHLVAITPTEEQLAKLTEAQRALYQFWILESGQVFSLPLRRIITLRGEEKDWRDLFSGVLPSS